jgi:hypothetical protein
MSRIVRIESNLTQAQALQIIVWVSDLIVENGFGMINI